MIQPKFSYPPILFSDSEMEFLRQMLRDVVAVPMPLAHDAASVWDKIVECPALEVPPDASG